MADKIIRDLSSVVQIDGQDYNVHAKTAKTAETVEKLANTLTISVQNQGDTNTTTIAEFDGSEAKTATITIPAIPSDYVTTDDLKGKQETLVSGTNIKTINGESLLGEGNIIISGGTGGGGAGDTIYVKNDFKDENGELIGDVLATITIKSSEPQGGAVGAIWFKY